MLNISIWPIDRTLSSATTPGQSEPGSNGTEGVLLVLQSSSITEASPSDCLLSYPENSLEGTYPLAEMYLMHSTAPADWAKGHSLGESYHSAEMHLVYSTAPTKWARNTWYHITMCKGLKKKQHKKCKYMCIIHTNT